MYLYSSLSLYFIVFVCMFIFCLIKIRLYIYYNKDRVSNQKMIRRNHNKYARVAHLLYISLYKMKSIEKESEYFY